MITRLVKPNPDTMKMVDELQIHIPRCPESVNHYKKPTGRKGRAARYYVTPETEAYYMEVYLAVARRRVPGKTHALSIDVHLGPKMSGDLDNFAKVVSDGLVHAGALASDATVVDLRMRKYRTDDKWGKTFIVLRKLT